MFAEPRSDIHDLAAALVKLVRAEGPQSLRGVFKRLPNYAHLTKGDRQWSLTRRGDRMWQTEVRNLSRNQNGDPKYRKYKALPNCPLEYVGMKAGSHSGRFELRETHIDRMPVECNPSAPLHTKVTQVSLFDLLDEADMKQMSGGRITHGRRSAP